MPFTFLCIFRQHSGIQGPARAGEKAGIGAEAQIRARFSDKSLARNTGVRRDHKDVNKVKGPRPAELQPSIAPKM